MKFRYVCLWIITLLLGSLMSLNAVTDRAIPGQVEALGSVPADSFRFVVLPDRAGGAREEVFLKAVAAIGRLDPDFVVTVGDQIEGYTSDLDELQGQWDGYMADIDPLTCPFLMTPGNHDNLLAEQKDLWTERLGPNYYHYRVGDVLFLHLDSQDNADGGGYLTGIGDEQLSYMEAALEENCDVSWTFVMLHQPIWSVVEDWRVHEAGGTELRGRHSFEGFDDNGNWTRLEALLKNRKHTVFAGHEHFYRYEIRSGNEYYTLATAGGGSPLNGLVDGTFDHLTLVSMEKGEEPVIANLLLDGILPRDVVTTSDGIALNAVNEAIPEPDFEPLLVEPGVEARYNLRLELKNPSDHPLEYDLVLENLGGLRVGKSHFTGTIGSMSETLVEIPVWRSPQDPIPENPCARIALDYRIPLHGEICFEKTYTRDVIFWAPRPGTILGINHQEGHGVEFLQDGDMSTYWTFHGRDARFLYALPEEREVDAIQLAFYHGDNRKTNFEIWGSSNLRDWETLFEGSSSGTTEELETFPFNKPATVRYLYFVGHGSVASQWNSILEMKLGQ